MAALDMPIGRSRRFLMLLLFVHSLSAAVVSATDMPVAAKAAAVALILFSLVYYWARDILRLLPDSWVAISVDSDGVTVTTADGTSFVGQVESMTFVSPSYMVFRIVAEGRHVADSRLIFSDALGGGLFRELCVRLRIV